MEPKKESDPFYKLKYMGYCLSQLPPDGITVEMRDFINFAKFQLSLEKRILLEDPIWDKYSDEQLLVEYFAISFSKNEERRKQFESGIRGSLSPVDDFFSWADSQISKNQKDLEEKAKDLEDNISFSPDSLGE